MEIADIILALGGDTNNTVPKTAVTASEIAVLQQIHGFGSVMEIKPTGESPNGRGELQRLRDLYGKAMDNNNKSILETVFPGSNPRLFTKLSELNLVPEQFAATDRHKAPAEEILETEEVEKPKPTSAKAKAKAVKEEEDAFA